jgi:hypothetical protein
MILPGKRAAMAGVLLFCLALVLFPLRVHREMVDFRVNYTAGERLSHGESLYRPTDGHYQFKYPPFAAMLYVPLTALPLPAAKAVWYLLILCASAGVFYLAWRLSPPGSGSPAWAAWLPLLILGRYFLRELQLGQINALITLLLLLMTAFLLRAERPGHPAAEPGAGLLWGLSVALKPYALIFLPYLVLKKKFRALGAGAAFLALAVVLPALYYGFPGDVSVHRQWIKSLSESTPRLLVSQDNVSLLALAAKWTGSPDLAFKLWIVGVCLLAGLMYLLVRRGRRLENPVPLDCALLLLLIPLISPLGWDYTLLAAVPAVAIISRRLRDFSAAARFGLAPVMAVIPLSLYDLLGRRFYARFMSLSVITLCFLVLAGYGAALRLRNRC